MRKGTVYLALWLVGAIVAGLRWMGVESGEGDSIALEFFRTASFNAMSIILGCGIAAAAGFAGTGGGSHEKSENAYFGMAIYVASGPAVVFQAHFFHYLRPYVNDLRCFEYEVVDIAWTVLVIMLVFVSVMAAGLFGRHMGLRLFGGLDEGRKEKSFLFRHRFEIAILFYVLSLLMMAEGFNLCDESIRFALGAE